MRVRMAASFLAVGFLLPGSAATAQEKSSGPETLNWRIASPALDLPSRGPVIQGSSTGSRPELPRTLPASWDIRPALVQVPPQQPVKAPTEEPMGEVKIQLDPPGPDRIFRRDSETTLQERMRQEGNAKTPPDRVKFPEEPILSKDPYSPRTFSPSRMQVEPAYVCYGRLYFEELNSERYGWDLGFIQPIVSAGKFFSDLVTLPYHLGTAPCRKYDCSAGFCLPGDPVPYMLYPPDLSLSGAILESGTIFGLVAIFPG